MTPGKKNLIDSKVILIAFVLSLTIASTAGGVALASESSALDLQQEAGSGLHTVVRLSRPISLRAALNYGELLQGNVKSLGFLTDPPSVFDAGTLAQSQISGRVAESFESAGYLGVARVTEMRLVGALDPDVIRRIVPKSSSEHVIEASPVSSPSGIGPSDGTVYAGAADPTTDSSVTEPASDGAQLWAPYKGWTNAYEAGTQRVIESTMSWDAAAVYFFSNLPAPMVYEHDLKLINPENVELATIPGASHRICLPAQLNDFWANRSNGVMAFSTLPEWYLDTDIGDECGEHDLTVGTYSPDLLLPEEQYEINLYVAPGDASSSLLRVRGEHLEKFIGVDDPHLIGLPVDSEERDSDILISKSIAYVPGCWKWINADTSGASQCTNNGLISTVAGNGTWGYSGDGGAATNAQLDSPLRIDVDDEGSVYVADQGNHSIRKIDSAGNITTIAGQGPEAPGYSGDGGPATAANLRVPWGIDVASDGSVYVAEYANCVIRRIEPSGIISTVAGERDASPGPWCAGSGGNGGPALAPVLDEPMDVAVQDDGSFFVADAGNSRIVRIEDGLLHTVIGPSDLSGGPLGIALEADGDLLVADTYGAQLLRLTASGVTTVVHSGDCDGGTAGFCPRDIAAAPDGTIYIADAYQVWRLEPDDEFEHVMGNGAYGYTGDGGPGWAAQMGFTHGVAVSDDEAVFASDNDFSVIRKLAPVN